MYIIITDIDKILNWHLSTLVSSVFELSHLCHFSLSLALWLCFADLVFSTLRRSHSRLQLNSRLEVEVEVEKDQERTGFKPGPPRPRRIPYSQLFFSLYFLMTFIKYSKFYTTQKHLSQNPNYVYISQKFIFDFGALSQSIELTSLKLKQTILML